jgi:hypothetical protein
MILLLRRTLVLSYRHLAKAKKAEKFAAIFRCENIYLPKQRFQEKQGHA